MKLKNLFGKKIMSWMRRHGTLKFSPPHMNSTLVDNRKSFKISSAKTTHKSFRNTPLPPPSPHHTLKNPTNLSLQLLHCQTERNRVILGKQKRPVLRL